MPAEGHAERTRGGRETERTESATARQGGGSMQSGCDGPKRRRLLARDERTVADAETIEAGVGTERVDATEFDDLDRRGRCQ